jgi:alanyl-tRNA synthetase
VHQQGSLVAPDRLHFDFSHHSRLAKEELDAVAAMVNGDVMTDAHVDVEEMSRVAAEAVGALAFFKEKYGDRVRVVRAGPHSVELCGGTHVSALGRIGPVAIVSESSTGANTRRIEAVTGPASFERYASLEDVVQESAGRLRTEPENLAEAVDRALERQRAAERALEDARGREMQAEAGALVSQASDGVVVARRDGLEPDRLRDLASATRAMGGLRAVVVAGSPDGGRASLAVAADPAASANGAGRVHAGELVRRLAPLLGGGGGGKPELAVAGGKDASGIDRALEEARTALGGG